MASTHDIDMADYHQKLTTLTESEAELKAGQKEKLEKAHENLAALDRALQKLPSGQKENLKVVTSSYSSVHLQLTRRRRWRAKRRGSSSNGGWR
jgi:uncharacterized membrane protein YgaE (UPF0421/DUF939 family)